MQAFRRTMKLDRSQRQGFVSALPWCAAIAILLSLWAGMAAAHFQLNVNIRVLHIEHLDDGLRVYLRLPTPYVLAPLIGEEQADGGVAPAPYSSNKVI